MVQRHTAFGLITQIFVEKIVLVCIKNPNYVSKPSSSVFDRQLLDLGLLITFSASICAIVEGRSLVAATTQTYFHFYITNDGDGYVVKVTCVTRRELAVKSGLALLLGFPMICEPNGTQVMTAQAQHRQLFIIFDFAFDFLNY